MFERFYRVVPTIPSVICPDFLRRGVRGVSTV
jgi:hypothetical protein